MSLITSSDVTRDAYFCHVLSLFSSMDQSFSSFFAALSRSGLKESSPVLKGETTTTCAGLPYDRITSAKRLSPFEEEIIAPSMACILVVLTENLPFVRIQKEPLKRALSAK